MTKSIVNFWLKQENNIHHWQAELKKANEQALVIGRVANLDSLRTEFEQIFEL